jgi:ADP-ribose pyrophosphatase
LRKPTRLSRTVIYENPWVNLYVDKVEFPSGRIIEKHHVLEFEKEAVAVLVHAYRYTTDSIEWEVPAGIVEPGEAIIEAAKREVREESGYETEDHELIYTFYPMNGISNKVFHIVHGYATGGTGVFDRNEVQEFKWVSKPEIQEMIRDRLVRDGYTLTALLLHLMH